MDIQQLQSLPPGHQRQVLAGNGRILQFGHSQDSQNGRPRTNRSARRRHKILKLMTEAQIEARFPIKTFKLAAEESPLHHSNLSKPNINSERTVTTTSMFQKSETSTKHDDYAVSEYETTSDGKTARQSKRLSLNLLRPFSLVNRNSNSHTTSHAGPINTPVREADLSDSRIAFEKNPDLEAQLACDNKGVNPQSQRFSCLGVPTLTQINSHDYTDTETDTEDNVPAMTDMEGSLNTCAICIDDMDDTTNVRGLTCGHIFHPECIDPWLLTRQARCPLCKMSFYTPKPEDPLGPEPVEVLEAQYISRQRAEQRQRMMDLRAAAGENVVRRVSRRLWGSRHADQSPRTPTSATAEETPARTLSNNAENNIYNPGNSRTASPVPSSTMDVTDASSTLDQRTFTNGSRPPRESLIYNDAGQVQRINRF